MKWTEVPLAQKRVLSNSMKLLAVSRVWTPYQFLRNYCDTNSDTDAIVVIILWASVIKTVSSQTLSIISGPFQGSHSTSTLMNGDCLSPINFQDVVFISAVPIAIGFGLLLLLAFLQDLKQARKGNRSHPPSPCNWGNRARKERTCAIDVDYAGRSCWGAFLRWCAMHKSPGAKKNPRLMRLQGTIGFSNWLSFDLEHGKNSEQKTLTTPRSIGKLVAVEMKYPSASTGLTSQLLPTSTIGACLRGLIQRACDIKIKKIHALDTKTQDHYTSGCGSSSGGISSTDQGITTTLPLLPSSQPASRVSYTAYFFKASYLWTSAFTPWSQGNFTGSRHITYLFVCVSYTMIAAQVVSKFPLAQSMEEAILVSLTDVNITTAMLVRAILVASVIFTLPGFTLDITFRLAPTIWNLHLPCVSPRPRNGNRLTDGLQLTRAQSAAGDFYSSFSADTAAKHSDDGVKNGKSNIQPDSVLSSHVAITVSDNIDRDNQSICAADQLECHHKLTCHKCHVCHLTTGSRFYDPGACCSGENTLTDYDLKNLGRLLLPGYAYSSSSFISEDSLCSSLSSNSSMASLFNLTDDSSGYFNESGSPCISESTSIISGQPLDEQASYSIQGAIKTKESDDNLNFVNKPETPPSMSPSKELMQHEPDTIPRATSTSGLLDKKHKTTYKQEAGEGEDNMKQEDIIVQEKFIKYSDALRDPEIKRAKVLRTKNYISRFSDMGKGKIVNLPLVTKSCDVFLSRDNSATKKIPDIKTSLSESGTKSECEMGTIVRIPCHPVTTRSNYTLNLPLEFEMPSVTIQSSRSNKPLFFGFRKWLAGLRSKPKVDIDNYKLEVLENDAALKNLDENICRRNSHDAAVATSTIRIDETTGTTISKGSSLGITTTTLPNIPDNDNDAKVVDDHLKQSIFQSSSRLIVYQPDAISVTSSGSWSSISSFHSASNSHPVTPWKDVNATNKNNNSNETTVINIDILSSSTTCMPRSSSSEEYVSFDSNKTSSSSVIPNSTSSEGICSSNGTHSSKEASGKDAHNKDFSISTDLFCITSMSSYNTSSTTTYRGSSSDMDEDNPRLNRYHYYQALYDAEQTVSPTEDRLRDTFLQTVLFLVLHILLIASCVFVVMWSVLSFHGLCWNAFWEWLATSIIAILIQAVILDMIKAASMTFIKWYYDTEEAKPRPYSVIQ